MKAGLRRIVSHLQILTGFALVVFWFLFFVFDLLPENPPECYLVFERAFPLPDAALAVTLLLAGLFGYRKRGRVLSLVSAGALVFLGLLDFSFNIQNGVYHSSAADLVLNAFINLWAVGFGTFTILAYARSFSEQTKHTN